MRQSLYLAAVALVANVATGIPLGPKGSFFHPAIPSTNTAATLKLLHNAHDRANNGSEGIAGNKTEATAKHDVELPKKIEDRPVTHQFLGHPWFPDWFPPYRSYKDKDIGRGKRVGGRVGIIKPAKREDGEVPKKIDDVPAADGGDGVAGNTTESTTKHYTEENWKSMSAWQKLDMEDRWRRHFCGHAILCVPLPLNMSRWDEFKGPSERHKTITPTKKQDGEVPKRSQKFPWVGKTPPEGLGKRDTTYRPIRITEFNSEGEVVKEQTLMRKMQA